MKKPTIKELQASLAEAQTTAAGLQQKLTLAEAEVSGLRKSTKEYEETARKATEQVKAARRALDPFRQKTAQWEWPTDGIMAVAPITFGDLRVAAETAGLLQ